MEKVLISSGTKQKITVTVDSNLIADIDNFTNNRSAAVEEALFYGDNNNLRLNCVNFI